MDAFTTTVISRGLMIISCDLDLQKLIRSPAGASEYSVTVLSELFKAFMRYHGNNIFSG